MLKQQIAIIASFLFLASIAQSWGRSVVDVVFYHHRITTMIGGDVVNAYPLLPQEDKIANFPLPLKATEANLAVLRSYYQDVTQSYQTYLDKDLGPEQNKYKAARDKSDKEESTNAQKIQAMNRVSTASRKLSHHMKEPRKSSYGLCGSSLDGGVLYDPRWRLKEF